MASLTVRYSRSIPDSGTVLSFSLVAEVVNAVGMTRKVFMVLRSVPSVTDPEARHPDFLDEFSHVATPLDLYNTPEDAPDFEKSGSWYRTDKWEFSFRSTDDLEESLDLLRNDIASLVKSINSEAKVEEYMEETYE
jgi:hypothetical protein